MKKKIFAANWKLNKSPREATAFALKLKTSVGTPFFQNKDIFIFPQNFSLAAVADGFTSTNVLFGPQQIHSELKGAFTGENSLEIARQMGSQICLIGHSERRQFFGEDDQAVAAKVKICQDMNVLPVLCVGETLDERKSGKTFDVLYAQLANSLENIDKGRRLIVAYEPVWAIGTGQVATVDQVEEVHHKLHERLTGMGLSFFEILYGGSVKADNARELIQVPHVDGFLIGGASLEVESFLSICRCVE